jgi:hypothetical protein
MVRSMMKFSFAVLLTVSTFGTFACKSSGTDPQPADEPRYQIVRPEEKPAEQSGLPVDKQNEIQLILQQREPSSAKCYTDVLNEKQDRKFQGQVTVVIHFEKTGVASDVKVITSTLNNEEVESCLVEKIKGFEFPVLETPGDMHYSYVFRPAY